MAEVRDVTGESFPDSPDLLILDFTLKNIDEQLETFRTLKRKDELAQVVANYLLEKRFRLRPGPNRLEPYPWED